MARSRGYTITYTNQKGKDDLTGGMTLKDVMEKYETAANQAKAANLARYEEGKGIWDNIVSQYRPGGGFGSGAMANYERGKVRDIGKASQALVSSGLYNTTMGAGLEKKYEEEVGTPFKLNLEDLRMQRYAQAMEGKAGFVERREDAYPDAGLYANLMQNVGQGQAIANQPPTYTSHDSGDSLFDTFRSSGYYPAGDRSVFNTGGGGSSGSSPFTKTGYGSSSGGVGGTGKITSQYYDKLAKLQGKTYEEVGGPEYLPGGSATIWGDPYVRNKEGDIIGSRQDLVDQNAAMVAGTGTATPISQTTTPSGPTASELAELKALGQGLKGFVNLGYSGGKYILSTTFRPPIIADKPANDRYTKNITKLINELGLSGAKSSGSLRIRNVSNY